MLSATTAQAALEITFSDGAGGDQFSISNEGCPLSDAILVIDLTTSADGVVVDTEYGGRGTQDPLPMQVVQGDIALLFVQDGMQVIHVQLNNLPSSGLALITLDVDDTRSPGYGDRVAVTGSEIAGAGVTLSVENGQTQSAFSADGSARIAIPPTASGCLLS